MSRTEHLLYPDQPLLETPSAVLREEERYLDLIQKAKEAIDIFAGEANPWIYSATQIADALTTAHQRGVTIRMVIGPVLCVTKDSGRRSRSTILDLLRSQTIELYVRERRESKGHYRIADSQYFDWENPHLPLRSLTYLDHESPPPIKELMADFRQYMDGKAHRCDDPEKCLLFMTEQEIRGVWQLSGGTYDNLTLHQLSEFLTRLHQRWSKTDANIRQYLEELKNNR